MTLGPILQDFGVPVGHFSIIFGSWSYLARVGAPGADFGAKRASKKHVLGSNFTCFFKFFGVCFSSRFSEGFRIFFLMILGSFWGPSWGHFRDLCGDAANLQKCSPAAARAQFLMFRGASFPWFSCTFFKTIFRTIFLLIFLVLGALGAPFSDLFATFFQTKIKLHKKRFWWTNCLVRRPPRGVSLTPLSFS